MTTINAYCAALGIQTPSLAVARKSPDANCYSLLIVALLEKDEPITLPEAARRFEEAWVAAADRALASLKRCRPGRSPIYRDGDGIVKLRLTAVFDAQHGGPATR